LRSEKSEPRHIGSSPSEKGDFGSGDVDGLGQSVDARNATNKMRNRHTTVARAAVLCRFLAVSSIDAWTSLAAGSKKEAGNLTVYDAGPSRGSKCAIDHANFAVV
jgi:hypothetical protein